MLDEATTQLLIQSMKDHPTGGQLVALIASEAAAEQCRLFGVLIAHWHWVAAVSADNRMDCKAVATCVFMVSRAPS